jgi:putative aldouronate transport system substrate-binding protein
VKKRTICILAFLLTVSVVFAQGAKEVKKSVGSEGPVEISYWVPLNANITQIAQHQGLTEYTKELEKRTNTKLKFQHVATGSASQTNEGFNILVASGNYPDVIEYYWIDYPGSPASAIADGVIIPLNDVFEKYCPNISKLLKDNPDIAKMVSTEDGQYYVFPFLRGLSYEDNMLIFSEGWVIRKDLMNKAGISDVPRTPEEWETMLKAFKAMGIKNPMTLRKDHVSRALAPGFDSHDDFYVENGKVHYGLIEPERKKFLETVARWYKEGLLDNDFFSVDKKIQATKVLNNEVGATYAPGGSGIGTWLPAMQKTNPAVELVSAPPMSAVQGRNSKFSKMNTLYNNSGTSAAISTSCKNVEAVAKFLDYAYGEEGHLLTNFGIEGLTYTMVDGYPTYTDTILNNGNGLSITQAMSTYFRGHISGPFVQDQRELEQYYQLPELKQALKLWTMTDMGKYIYPPASPSIEDSETLAQILNNVKTYSEEMESKFIAGILPISEFNNYVTQIKKFGIEKAIAIKQAAYDGYMAKK